MTDRVCIDCGVPEERRIEHGRELVNLDPVSGRCVSCLARAARLGAPMWPADDQRDWAKAAAHDDGDES